MNILISICLCKYHIVDFNHGEHGIKAKKLNLRELRVLRG